MAVRAVLLGLALALVTVRIWAALPFPAGPPVEVTQLNEASGVVWHPRLFKLYAADDNGRLWEFNDNGTGLRSWAGLNDVEGVTYADENEDFVYLVRERPTSAIIEFDLVAETVNRIFDLSTWIDPVSSNEGPEAITFVPDAASAEGGYFYIGVQEDGSVHVFELPLITNPVSVTPVHLGSFIPRSDRVDMSGMDFDRDNRILYVLWDTYDRFSAYRLSGVLLADWNMYTDSAPNQEGIAVDPSNKRLFSTEDDSNEVYAYAGFEFDGRCTIDADCSNSVFCDGDEVCDEFGDCQAGPPRACPGQVCSESLDQCVGCETSSNCSPGTACVPLSGTCVPVPPADPLPIVVGDTWTWFKGNAAPPIDWASIPFDDSTWLAGASGFGYGPDCSAELTTVLSDMQSNYASVYTRRLFDVVNPLMLDTLTLTVDYDDGFVAYLNSVEAPRSNVSGTPPANTQLAASNHECSGGSPPNPAELYALDTGLLVEGTNVLAIQAHNLTVDSSDFSIIASLDAVARPACSSNPECDDGFTCNGLETCLSGSCEAGAPSPDSDGDRFCDAIDICPDVHDPFQLDADTDGHGDTCDCAPRDDQAWEPSGEAANLMLIHSGGGAGTTTLSWIMPQHPGAVSVAYDTIRSTSPDSFASPGNAFCLESGDGSDTESIDTLTPAAGTAHYFLVRAVNACGPGSLGVDSGGLPRAGISCP